MILETLDGAAELAEVLPGQAVYVPGHWVHRSVNVEEERFVTLSLVVDVSGRWSARPNPDHRCYHLPQRQP
jgi:glucose-6-phosphate isomerase, archaeal